MAHQSEVGNKIEHHSQLGFFISVYDHRPETLEFMNHKRLQGDGPTWTALIKGALELESPNTLLDIQFSEEAGDVLVTSASEATLGVVQSFVSLIMFDPAFRKECIAQAKINGYLA